MKKTLPEVVIYTDGACDPNPGRGGWAALILTTKGKMEISGRDADSTNNRMELTAAIRALEALREPCEVELTTDSQYVKNGIESWIAKWKRNGWKTADKKPVLNQDLWQDLDAQTHRHRVRWSWTKGHADHDDNNRCDELAREAAGRQRK